MTWTCKYCGHPNLMSYTHCSNCGKPRGYKGYQSKKFLEKQLRLNLKNVK